MRVNPFDPLPHVLPASDLTVAEVAALAKVHSQTVRGWIRRGELRAYRVGPRAIRVREEDLAAMKREIPSAADR